MLQLVVAGSLLEATSCALRERPHTPNEEEWRGSDHHREERNPCVLEESLPKERDLVFRRGLQVEEERAHRHFHEDGEKKSREAESSRG